MSPYDQLETLYDQHPQELPFAWYVHWHIKFGFVLSRPDVFVMGRPIVKRVAEANGVTMDEPEPGQAADTWFVHAAAGDLQRAWELIPWNLPYVAWERVLDRQRDLRFYDAGRVRRLFLRPSTPILST